MRRRTVHLVMTVSAIVVGTLGAPNVAGADHPFGYPNPGFVADSTDHWYCHGTVTDSNQIAAIDGSMDYLDYTTEMYDVYSSTCGSATDVVWATVDYPLGQRGETSCVNWVAWGICDQYWIGFDAPEILIQSTACSTLPAQSAQLNLVKTIRHELGQSAGLSHGGGASACSAPGEDAMRSGWVPTNIQWTTFNAHRVGQIDDHYT